MEDIFVGRQLLQTEVVWNGDQVGCCASVPAGWRTVLCLQYGSLEPHPNHGIVADVLQTAPLFGYLGAAAALVFACTCAAYDSVALAFAGVS
jgi:hypothetical protein